MKYLIFFSILCLSCSILFIGCSKVSNKLRINKVEAVKIILTAEKDPPGTWVYMTLKNNNWHFSSRSKSAKPPNYYVVSGKSGKIIYSNLNAHTGSLKMNPPPDMGLNGSEAYDLRYEDFEDPKNINWEERSVTSKISSPS